MGSGRPGRAADPSTAISTSPSSTWRISTAAWVYVHPVAFDKDGHGRQADLDGEVFDYPRDAFSRRLIAGHGVPCLSARQQRLFHAGHEHRAKDIHDMAQLDALPDQ